MTQIRAIRISKYLSENYAHRNYAHRSEVFIYLKCKKNEQSYIYIYIYILSHNALAACDIIFPGVRRKGGEGATRSLQERRNFDTKHQRPDGTQVPSRTHWSSSKQRKERILTIQLY